MTRKKGKGKKGEGDQASTSSQGAETPEASHLPATQGQPQKKGEPQQGKKQQGQTQEPQQQQFPPQQQPPGQQQKEKKGKMGKGSHQEPQVSAERGHPSFGQQQQPGPPPGFPQQAGGGGDGFAQHMGGSPQAKGRGAVPKQQHQPPVGGPAPQQQYQQQRGRGAPRQQQQPPGWGAVPQQQPPGWGAVPQQQPPGRGAAPQQQPQGWGAAPQQQPPGWGAAPQQQYQQPSGHGTPFPQQQPQQQSLGLGGASQQQRGRGAPRKQQQQPQGQGTTHQQQYQQPSGRGISHPQQQQQQPPGWSAAPQQSYQQPRGRGAPPPQQQQQSRRPDGPPSEQPRGPGAPSPQKQQTRQETAPTTLMSQLAISGGGDIAPIDFQKFPPGVKGRKIPVETNHLPLNLGNLTRAIHYDVNIIPDTPKKYLRTVMDLFREKYYPKRWPAFDGRKNLYSSSMLPFGDVLEGEVILRENDGREKQYKVQVKFANDVDLSPMKNYELSRATPREALQVIDIVLRSAPAQRLISVGRSFFVKPPQIIDLGEGMEMYHGFYQSAIRGWKPFLNVDVAHKAFPKNMPVVDALIDVVSNRYRQMTRDDLSRPLDRNSEETFTRFIRTLKIIYEIPGVPSSRRGYRVNGLNECAASKTFQLDNGSQTTIQRYFEEQKRYRLRYPNLPTLWVGDRNRPNPILLPMELCTIEEGQVVNRKMTENQTATMIKSSATNTDIRKRKINDGIRQANFNDHPSVREFGFSVSNVFEKLDARVLQPPMLGYANNQTINPQQGVWRGNQFFQGATINRWTIVAADRRPPRSDDFEKLEDNLYRNARPSGLIMNSRAERPFQTIGDRLPDIKKYFQNQKGKYDVIFVIVPNSGQQYSFVKSAAEINVGCLTQCVKSKTIFKINPQTATNILLKVNAKLNGTNHFLSTRPGIMNKPTMIMGADVTHPSPDSTGIPSVAAVTASHDPKAFKYNICWRLQPPTQEIIDDLKNITVEHLKYFYDKNNGVKPQRIIFFRDGVSEGQFEEVRSAEIRAIRAACKELQSDDYEPAITFLVVQKRHHTRLFPLNQRDSKDRNNNVPAGTCVDYQITHPFMQDFYLVSHASIQGVAKPTKYCTLWDDNKLSNDDIEELTYFLCHMFTRCNRSVSYPAPTYYAHLAAARAKVYIENDRIDLDHLNREYERFQTLDVIRKGTPMFFV